MSEVRDKIPPSGQPQQDQRIKKTSEECYWPTRCTDELLHEMYKRKYDEELENAKKLDDKSNNLIGFISIISGILLSEGAFNIPEYLKNNNGAFLLPLYLVSIGILIYALIIALGSFKVRKWQSAPSIDDLDLEKGEYITYTDPEKLIVNLNDDLLKAIKANSENNASKAEYLKMSWYALTCGLGLVFLFIVLESALIFKTT